jgi:hypothetical protein
MYVNRVAVSVAQGSVARCRRLRFTAERLPRGARLDTLRRMENLRIESIESPVDNPAVLRALMPVINRVWAMGIPMPGRGRPIALSSRTLKLILESAQRVGIGRNAGAYLGADPHAIERNPDEAVRWLNDLSRAIEESPVPRTEWPAMRATLGDEQLEALLGTSRQSIARYVKGERETPGEIAERLHWLAMVVADLAGAYNELGIRRWFHRARTALGGRSPLAALGKDWTPGSAPARQVRALAAALTDSGAT